MTHLTFSVVTSVANNQEKLHLLRALSSPFGMLEIPSFRCVYFSIFHGLVCNPTMIFGFWFWALCSAFSHSLCNLSLYSFYSSGESLWVGLTGSGDDWSWMNGQPLSYDPWLDWIAYYYGYDYGYDYGLTLATLSRFDGQGIGISQQPGSETFEYICTNYIGTYSMLV